MGMSKKRWERRMKKRAKKLLNAGSEYFKRFSEHGDMRRAIDEAAEQIDSFYQDDKLDALGADVDAQVLLYKLNELKYGMPGTKESLRSLVIGLASGVISSLVIGAANWTRSGELILPVAENIVAALPKLPPTLAYFAVFTALIFPLILFILLGTIVFFILIGAVYKAVHDEDTDAYRNFIRPYEIEVIEATLQRRHSFTAPRLGRKPLQEAPALEEKKPDSSHRTFNALRAFKKYYKAAKHRGNYLEAIEQTRKDIDSYYKTELLPVQPRRLFEHYIDLCAVDWIGETRSVSSGFLTGVAASMALAFFSNEAGLVFQFPQRLIVVLAAGGVLAFVLWHIVHQASTLVPRREAIYQTYIVPYEKTAIEDAYFRLFHTSIALSDDKADCTANRQNDEHRAQ